MLPSVAYTIELIYYHNILSSGVCLEYVMIGCLSAISARITRGVGEISPLLPIVVAGTIYNSSTRVIPPLKGDKDWK